jgi:hypothetical protein
MITIIIIILKFETLFSKKATVSLSVSKCSEHFDERNP